MLSPVITIDGLSGSGKGTISQRLSSELHYHFLDSGAIYRTLALLAQRYKVDAADSNKLEQLIPQIHLKFIIKSSNEVDVLLDGQAINKEIRSASISQLSSKIAVFPNVRSALVDLQRSFRKPPGLVADGRDMGTVIFPDAVIKIFLLASAEERAKRRYQQLLEQGNSVTLRQLIVEMTERDRRDEQRKASPTKPALDAVIIDTSLLSIEEVLDRVRAVVSKKLRN